MEEENLPHMWFAVYRDTDGGHQLDHIISIRYGFDNGIPPEELAKPENLRIIPWRDNLLKGKNCEGNVSF